jgi:hypothetical protein
LSRAYAAKLEKLKLTVESIHKNYAISSTAYNAFRTAGLDIMKQYKNNTKKKNTGSNEEVKLSDPVPAEPGPEPKLVPELDLKPATASESSYEAIATELFVFDDPYFRSQSHQHSKKNPSR